MTALSLQGLKIIPAEMRKRIPSLNIYKIKLRTLLVKSQIWLKYTVMVLPCQSFPILPCYFTISYPQSVDNPKTVDNFFKLSYFVVKSKQYDKK